MNWSRLRGIAIGWKQSECSRSTSGHAEEAMRMPPASCMTRLCNTALFSLGCSSLLMPLIHGGKPKHSMRVVPKLPGGSVHFRHV